VNFTVHIAATPPTNTTSNTTGAQGGFGDLWLWLLLVFIAVGAVAAVVWTRSRRKDEPPQQSP
jgi:hypothetical protein